ncbi:MAG: hypothetical protein JJU00_04030 [Opitutales bacterium]|nr:hypothetical protein [Opitutales bacterium]
MNKYIPIRLAAALSALLLGPTLSFADKSPAVLFGDETIFFAETLPLAGMIERWSENDGWDFVQNEDYMRFVRSMLTSLGVPLPEDLELDIRKAIPWAGEKLGLTEEEARELFAGRLAVGVSAANPAALAGFMDDDADEDAVLGRVRPGIRIVLTHDGKQELFEKAFAHLREEHGDDGEDDPFEVRKVDGFTVYEPKEAGKEHERGYLLYNDSLMVFSMGSADVSTVIGEVEGGLTSAFADRSIFQIGEDALADADVRVFARLDFLDEVLREAVPALMKDAAQMIEGGMVAAPDRLLDLVRIDALRGLYYTAKVDKDVVRFVSGLETEARGGLVNSLFAYTDGGLPDFDFVPADVTSVTVARYDVGAVLRAVDRLVPQVTPLYGNMYQAYKGQLASQSGVDLDQMLFRNFTDEVVILSFEPTTEEAAGVPLIEQMQMSTNVFVFSLHDGNRIVEGVDRLLAAFGMDGMLQKDEYLGATLYTVPMMMQQGTAAQQGIAVTDDRLVFSQGNLSKLRDVLALMASPEGGLAQTAAVRDYLGRSGDDAAGFGFVDVRRMLEGSAISARALMSLTGEDEVPPVPDFSGLDKVFLSRTVKTPYGLRQEGVVKSKDD